MSLRKFAVVIEVYVLRKYVASMRIKRTIDAYELESMSRRTRVQTILILTTAFSFKIITMITFSSFYAILYYNSYKIIYASIYYNITV